MVVAAARSAGAPASARHESARCAAPRRLRGSAAPCRATCARPCAPSRGGLGADDPPAARTAREHPARRAHAGADCSRAAAAAHRRPRRRRRGGRLETLGAVSAAARARAADPPRCWEPRPRRRSSATSSRGGRVARDGADGLSARTPPSSTRPRVEARARARARAAARGAGDPGGDDPLAAREASAPLLGAGDRSCSTPRRTTTARERGHTPRCSTLGLRPRPTRATRRGTCVLATPDVRAGRFEYRTSRGRTRRRARRARALGRGAGRSAAR